MRFSVWPTLAQPWDDVLEITRHAEATGWDGVYVMDHFMGNDGRAPGAVETPTLEGTARARRARRGHRPGPPRHPRARQHLPPPGRARQLGGDGRPLSGGRLLLGVGAGWQENEHEQYGIRAPAARRAASTASRRRARSGTGCCGSRSPPSPATHYQLTDAICEPKPVQSPLPLLIGGKGNRMMGVVARYADEWNMWGLADDIAERAAVLDQRCEAIGRDPAEIKRSAQALVLLTDDRAKADAFLAGHRRPGGHRRHHRRRRRGGRRVAGRRPRRGHRPRLHPRPRRPQARAPGRPHRAGRPALPLIHARSRPPSQLRVRRQRSCGLRPPSWCGRRGCRRRGRGPGTG